MERYRHTQVGWVIVISVLIAAVVFYPLLRSIPDTSLPALIAIGSLFVMLQFATMTVVLENRRIRFYFGLGMIRKSFDLATVVDYRQVKNPWHYGWGIHVFPGGTLYNVSGFSAIEITLSNGKRIRIGTDEPEVLVRALQRVIGRRETQAPSNEVAAHSPDRKSSRLALAIAVVVLTVIAGIGLIFYYEEQPPEVSLTPQRFRVESLMYSETFTIREITNVALTQRIPRIRQRTNGYSAGRTLRGYFTLDELGNGKLFIEFGVAPYLVVRSKAHFVIVNFENPKVTRNLYEQLEAIRSETADSVER